MAMRRPAHARRQASVDYPKYLPLNSTTQQPPPLQPEMVSHAVVASDYDSDQGYVSDLPRVAPPIARTRAQLNLAVIQKWNSEVTDILSIAPYVTIYDWSSNSWQKSGVVGTLFICQLTPGDYGELRYRAIVLNRSGLDNFEAELRQSDRSRTAISGDFVEITREDPETGETKASAVYIYSEVGTSTEPSRKANAELMLDLAEAAKRSRDAAEAHARLPIPEPDLESTFIPSPGPLSMQLHSRPSPAPPIAPVASKPVDLLALLRAGTTQSDAESASRASIKSSIRSLSQFWR
ncbi:hypothetical protein LTS08_008551 [Lithohypha guttulata]|nr:hypothetical protein LTS08_008551 [Lithohypha guttulata]